MRTKASGNLLDRLPLRQVEHEIDPETSKVVLLIPRFRNPLLKRLFGGGRKNPFVRITLDEIGSFLWLRMDGQTSLLTLSEKIRRNFCEKVEPAEERVALFARMLERNGAMILKKLQT